MYAEGAGAVELSDVQVDARLGLAAFFSGLDRVSLERVELSGPVPEPSGADFTDAVFIAVAPSAPEVVAMRSDAECGAAVARQCATDERREASCPGCGTVEQYCDGCGQWVSVMATQGLTLVDVSDASLTDLDVGGFAQFGVVARGDGASVLTWSGGAIERNLGHGLYADGVAVTLQDVSVERTYSGFRGSPGAGAYVVAMSGAGSIETHGLMLNDNRGYGMIQVGGASGLEVRHEGLMAASNGAAALWSGRNARFELSGAMLRDNAAGGVVIVEAGAAEITDTVVTGTQRRRLSVGADELFGAVELGDGIQIFDSLSQVSLRNVTLEANERVGLSLDLGAAGVDADICGSARDGICFDNVVVRADPGGRGAIAGNMTAEVAGTPHVYSVQPVGSGAWDVGIAREGAAVDDAGFASGLELAGVVGPLDTPVPAVVGPLD